MKNMFRKGFLKVAEKEVYLAVAGVVLAGRVPGVGGGAMGRLLPGEHP